MDTCQIFKKFVEFTCLGDQSWAEEVQQISQIGIPLREGHITTREGTAGLLTNSHSRDSPPCNLKGMIYQPLPKNNKAVRRFP